MTGPLPTGARPGAPEIRFYLPAEGLRPLVTSYYFVESVGPLADFTHPEWANIRFALNGVWRFEDDEGRDTIEPSRAALFGPTDRARRFMTDGGLVLGVGLTPIGWLTLIGSDASDLANRNVPLDRQLGISGPALHSRLVEARTDASALRSSTRSSKRGRRRRAPLRMAIQVQRWCSGDGRPCRRPRGATRHGTAHAAPGLHRGVGFPLGAIAAPPALLRTLGRCDRPTSRSGS